MCRYIIDNSLGTQASPKCDATLVGGVLGGIIGLIVVILVALSIALWVSL